MTIFDIVYNKPEPELGTPHFHRDCFVGIHVSRKLNDLLNLYSVSRGITRTHVARTALVGYFSKVIECEAELIRVLVDRALFVYKDRVWVAGEVPSVQDVEQFITDVRTELQNRKLAPEHVENVETMLRKKIAKKKP